MDFLHYEFELSANDVVEVSLDKQANVRVLDDANYSLYRRGKRFYSYGGLAKTSPISLAAPFAGHWHVVIDLGGFRGSVRASARVLSAA